MPHSQINIYVTQMHIYLDFRRQVRPYKLFEMRALSLNTPGSKAKRREYIPRRWLAAIENSEDDIQECLLEKPP
jgi:hypothetical protein